MLTIDIRDFTKTFMFIFFIFCCYKIIVFDEVKQLYFHNRSPDRLNIILYYLCIYVYK